MKRNLIFSFIILVGFLLISCVTNQTAKENKEQESIETLFQEPYYDWGSQRGKTITIWTKEHELDRIYMQRAFERYETLTGNKIQIVDIPKEEFEEIKTGAFMGQEQPDIILSYGGTNIEAFNPDENFYDFTNAPWVDDLNRTSINQTIYNGKVIGLPHWEASISGTIYNKKIFEKLKLKVPETQEEFMEVCKRLLDNGITPLYLPYQEISMLLYQFPLDSIVADSHKLNSLNNGQLTYLELPEMKQIVGWYRIMAENGYFGTSYQQNNWAGMNDAMRTGQYAMMLSWDTWLYTDFTGDASDFGLMPAFMGVPDGGTFEGPNLALLIVNKNSINLDAAVEFISFMADPYNYNIAFEGIYTAPVFKKQFASVSTPQYVENERLIDKKFRDSIAWLRIKGFSQMDAIYIQKYMTGETGYTLEQCLLDMDTARQERIQ